MDQNTKNYTERYILDVAFDCINFSEKATKYFNPNFGTGLQLLNQAFFCAKQLQEFYYSGCLKDELYSFYHQFSVFNLAYLTEVKDKSNIEKELRLLAELHLKLSATNLDNAEV